MMNSGSSYPSNIFVCEKLQHVSGTQAAGTSAPRCMSDACKKHDGATDDMSTLNTQAQRTYVSIVAALNACITYAHIMHRTSNLDS